MSPGERAYEADRAARPHYHDGKTRPPWADLQEVARGSWERNPRPLSCAPLNPETMRRWR